MMLLLCRTSSSYGFFGRIFSTIFTWYTRENSVISIPGLIMFMMLPMPVAFFMLMSSNNISLYISTGIIGSSSGAISALIGSTITSTSTSSSSSSLSSSSSSSSSDQVLICLSNLVVYQTVILPTNIPVGTLIFGYLAALNYQRDGHKICIWGLKCHQFTFITWGCACSIATSLSFLLHLRSRKDNLQKT